jgi:hypothetical protein
MGCCLLTEAAIENRRVTVAPSMHQVRTLALWGAKLIQNDPFSTFQAKSKKNSEKVIHNVIIHRNIWQPWFSSTIHDTVAILQGTRVNRPYYRSWSKTYRRDNLLLVNRNDLPCDQQLFNSRNRDASRLSSDLTVLVIKRIAFFNWTSILLTWTLFSQTAIFGRRVNKRYTGGFRAKLTREFTFISVFSRCDELLWIVYVTFSIFLFNILIQLWSGWRYTFYLCLSQIKIRCYSKLRFIYLPYYHTAFE